MINENDNVAGNYDSDLQPRYLQQDNKDYAFALIIGEVEKIRKQNGAYIWAFPIKWRDENNITTKERFGWEVEFENGFCTSYGYNSNDYSTYQDALEAAIKYFKSNERGDRNIFPIN